MAQAASSRRKCDQGRAAAAQHGSAGDTSLAEQYGAAAAKWQAHANGLMQSSASAGKHARLLQQDAQRLRHVGATFAAQAAALQGVVDAALDQSSRDLLSRMRLQLLTAAGPLPGQGQQQQGSTTATQSWKQPGTDRAAGQPWGTMLGGHSDEEEAGVGYMEAAVVAPGRGTVGPEGGPGGDLGGPGLVASDMDAVAVLRLRLLDEKLLRLQQMVAGSARRHDEEMSGGP